MLVGAERKKARESRSRPRAEPIHMIASPFQSTKWLTFGALLVRFFLQPVSRVYGFCTPPSTV